MRDLCNKRRPQDARDVIVIFIAYVVVPLATLHLNMEALEDEHFDLLYGAPLCFSFSFCVRGVNADEYSSWDDKICEVDNDDNKALLSLLEL